MNLKEDAAAIVNFLLEDVEKACADCEREFGVHNPNASHGICKRHALTNYKKMRPTPTVQAAIERVEKSPDHLFAPDLSKVAPEMRGKPFDHASNTASLQRAQAMQQALRQRQQPTQFTRT